MANSISARAGSRLLAAAAWPLLLALCSAPAAAQDATDPPADTPPMMDPDGAPLSDEVMAELPPLPDAMAMDGPGAAMATDIIVIGSRQRSRFVAPSSGATLAGDALRLQARATLGDTLAHLPGVSSTSFGPGVSRPVLRGYQGERTRLLVDGIQSLDVSNTSPDHAVAINPLIADRIEVLRGPQALLYASGTVGGVVNTEIGRLPRRAPRDGWDGALSAGFGSAASERTGGARVDVAAGPIIFHADGHFLRSDDLRIGGPVLTRALRTQALASADAGVRALADLSDRLPNSAARSWDIGGGVTIVDGGSSLGLSLAYADSFYGLPTRYSLDPAAPVGDTLIDLGQLRLDGRGQLAIDSKWVETLRIRFGWADYSHDEQQPDGTVLSTFSNEAIEARVEVVSARRGIWRVTSGVQYGWRDFRVIGSAPLLPASETEQFATFSNHEFDLRPLRIEVGTRTEYTDIQSRTDRALGNVPIHRSFTSYSVAVGASYVVAPAWTVALNGQYSERAPVAEELLTQGTDPGTQGVLLGNEALGEERSWGVEGVVRGFGARWSVEGAVHYTRFPDYIYAEQTGAVVDGLPVFQFTAASARYFGFELNAKADVAQLGGMTVGIDGLIDYNRATLGNSGGAVPRIPPLRLLGGIGARNDRFDARAELEWSARQGRVGAFETPTSGFVVSNASLSWRPWGDERDVALTVSANNIFDVVARRHASFLKDFAPLAGRDVRIALRWAW